MVNPRVLKKEQKLGEAVPMALPMLRQVGPAMATVAACVVATYLVPQLEFARPWTPGEPVPFWNLIGRPFEAEAIAAEEERAEEVEEVAQEVLAQKDPEPVVDPPREVVAAETVKTLPAYVAREGDDKRATQALELLEGNELDGFFEQLARTDASIEGAMVRVIHWGDSAIGIDGIPGAIRRRMQNRFGDGGHGFHLMAPPNTSYRHREVDFDHNDNWKKCFIIHKCRSDGFYGLGGTTFSSWGGGESSFAPHPERSSGKVSRFELYYAGQPEGGHLRLQVDDGEKIIVETAADQLEDRWHAIDVPDGPHELSVRAVGEGQVRLFGVTMERPGPGIVWDSAALVGAFTNRMNELDQDHLAAQMQHRGIDLVVFTFGGNDMIRKVKMSTYADEYRAVIDRVKKAKPEAACLVMAPLDHGERQGAEIVSRAVVPRMVQAQREAAESRGCAFFDTFAAMGGKGSAGRWYNRKPRLMSGDLGHATLKGHQVIGELFYRALLEAYVAYRARADVEGIPAEVPTRAVPTKTALPSGDAAPTPPTVDGTQAQPAAPPSAPADVPSEPDPPADPPPTEAPTERALPSVNDPVGDDMPENSDDSPTSG
ncbi:MAG: GDSL-type esterase/lipase family protein [Myxococcota bacterium]